MVGEGEQAAPRDNVVFEAGYFAATMRETINALRWSKADFDLGRLLEVLILKRLMSPQPLYQLGAWANQTVFCNSPKARPWPYLRGWSGTAR